MGANASVAAGSVDENGILWKASQPGSFIGPLGGATNVYDTLVASAKKNGPRPAAGVRPARVELAIS